MSNSVCSKCGMDMTEGARFCKACGSGSTAPDGDLVRQKRTRVTAGERSGVRLFGWIAGAVAIGVAAALVFVVVQGKGGAMARAARSTGQQPAFTSLAEQGGVISVPFAGIAGGKAHFYTTSLNGSTLKFFVLRKQDGSYGVALDACNACYRAKLGYRDDGNQVICNNCGMAFQSGDVGVVTGGCNPIPLAHTITRDAITISAKDLSRFANYF